MGSINQQIDDALPLMKVRAAKFDDDAFLPMDEWVGRDGPYAAVHNLLTRAVMNADRARDNLRENGFPSSDYPEYLQEFRDDVIDFMNLGALVLSVLPSDEAGEAA